MIYYRKRASNRAHLVQEMHAVRHISQICDYTLYLVSTSPLGITRVPIDSPHILLNFWSYVLQQEIIYGI